MAGSPRDAGSDRPPAGRTEERGLPAGASRHLVWYNLGYYKTRHLGSDFTDAEWAEYLYGKAGIPYNRPSPWWMVFERLVLAFGVPFAVFIFGRSLFRASDGFRQYPVYGRLPAGA